MVQDDPCSGAIWLQLEPNDGIVARGPVGRTPGLDDSLVGNDFDVSTHDARTEEREGAASFAVDLGRAAGEFAELPGIHERFKDAVGACFKLNFLMDGSRPRTGGLGAGAGRRETAQSDSGDYLASSGRQS